MNKRWSLDMPNLTDVYVPAAFWYKKDVTIRGGSGTCTLSFVDIGVLANHPNLQ